MSKTPQLAEPLQQIDRTCVMQRGRRLSYFGGCDYFRLSSHSAVLNALREALERFGLNVAASRRTTGNHLLYERLEDSLATSFDSETAVLASSGYASNLVVAQALAGEFALALIDERAHACLFDAARLLGCPLKPFTHRDVSNAAKVFSRSGARGRVLLLTDGLFSHSGEVAPLDRYLKELPPRVTLLVDDAHGAGTLGRYGRGTLEFFGVSRRRIIQTITLSKAFGVYGGAILGSRNLRNRIVTRSRYFIGNTPMPLPLAAAALESLRVFRGNPSLRRRLVFHTNYVKAALRDAGLVVNDGPGPIIPIHPRNQREGARLSRALHVAGIHPPFINYLGGSRDAYFRFAISSEHTPQQLESLVAVLTEFCST